MKVENAVLPKQEQLVGLLTAGGEGPITMLNLLKFKKEATYNDPAEPSLSGREAYARYGEVMRGIVEGAGGRMLFLADVDALVIGKVDELWDAAAIVEYPSRAAFVQIATSPEVQVIGMHREAGLAGQLLIQCTQRADI